MWGSCIGKIGPKDEICDFLDNNCDGSVDENDICLSEVKPPCVEDWECGTWSSCINASESFRDCYDKNQCNTNLNKPLAIKSCTTTSRQISLVETGAKKVKIFVKENTVFTVVLIGTIGLLLEIAWVISRIKKRKEFQ